MPIYLKPTVMKYRDPDSGEYKGITCFTDEAMYDAVTNWVNSHAESMKGFLISDDDEIYVHVGEWSDIPPGSVSLDKLTTGARQYIDALYNDVTLHDVAIYNLRSDMGYCADLQTTHKNNLVAAINEVNSARKNTTTSVLDKGAKGDGTTNDAVAIQNAINDVAGTGGIVYFPRGTYRVESEILFKSNQTLWFESGATLLRGSSSMTSLLRAYSESSWTGYSGVHDVHIIGGVFDGNSSISTGNVTLVATSHAKNITFENCTFKNAYGGWHNLEINSSYNVKVKNCIFDGAGKTGASGEMIQIDSAMESSMYPWSGVAYDETFTTCVDIDGCLFFNNNVSPAIGNHWFDSSASKFAFNQFIRIHNCIFDSMTGPSVIKFESHTLDVDIHDNTFKNCTTCIDYNLNETTVNDWKTAHYVHDNRFYGATTAIGSNCHCIAHSNIINGTYTA